MSAPLPRSELVHQLRRLGLGAGDLVMVHASLKAVGPVEDGAAGIVQALRDSIHPDGTLMAYVSWDRSPYEETLNGATLDVAARDAWPAFDPATAGTEPSFGLLNAFICRAPGVLRSAHPDANIAAIGAKARELIGEHPLREGYGPGSPLERFVQLGGKVLLLGAPLDSVTVLHHAETIADIPNKRRVRYEQPLLDAQGRKVWRVAEEFDTNGILDRFAQEGGMDAVETIARLYAAEGRHVTGMVGHATCHVFDARDIVRYGKAWLERNFG
ncbi:MAG: aminoglycoside 3-N-acetyltransferase [Comamonadaceae bacterium]|nr:MAG: aminoglycoside 3-N-acetyltransferase [Comamonadaceae bacterium]